MKDKEKQITEMAKVVRSILESRTDITFIPDLDKPIAEELIKHYQPNNMQTELQELNAKYYNDVKDLRTNSQNNSVLK